MMSESNALRQALTTSFRAHSHQSAIESVAKGT
jgi:hypothetical protein